MPHKRQKRSIDMASDPKAKTSKKTVGKMGIQIQALMSNKLRLTAREKKALSQALKAAGETFVASLKREEVIIVRSDDEPFFG